MHTDTLNPETTGHESPITNRPSAVTALPLAKERVGDEGGILPRDRSGHPAGRADLSRDSSTKAGARNEGGPSATASILVVDDEEPNRTLLRDPLEARGYSVAEAENGLQALEHIARQTPDVILLDLMMPGMNGFEVCRRLKGDPATAHVPILMVTALSDRKERLMGIEAGANDFLNKPIDIQDVLLRVANAVYTKHLFDELQVEREKSERLLLNILPPPIAKRMKNGELTIADNCPDATVLLADLVGFSTLAANIPPQQVVFLLNEIYTSFDLLVEKHGLTKIKTIGDAYMVAGGLLPGDRQDGAQLIDPAEATVELALAIKDQIEQFNQQYSTSIRMRIGINTGPVVAGVIGRNTFAYDIWGDAVNVACQLQVFCPPGAIQVAEATCQKLNGRYRFEGNHRFPAKGGGEVTASRLSNRC